jgi:serine phosphatase RsbU (regulator of sigma subunit)
MSPSTDKLSGLFADVFVIDRPRDTVSGDFHWFLRSDEDTCLVAAADCTGHGVPGAMVAAIGRSLLNEVVHAHPDDDPAQLLAHLDARMRNTLNQQSRGRSGGDGMDIALCRIDRARKELLFAGAHRPLYWMHNGQLTVINGDRLPVGGARRIGERQFSVHRIAYHAGDRIYLFSDGYVDQFGGPEGARFMTARFNDMLLRHQHLDMAGQMEVLERAFLDWKGGGQQVDDICVLGLEVA